jgi:hypothetical protein
MGELGESAGGRQEFSSLFGLLKLGSAMLEQLRIDHVMRIAASAVASVSSCALLAGYTAEAGAFRRVFGESDRTLDLLVEASSPRDGPLDSALAGWVSALFLHGNTELVGCLVLAAESTPADHELFLLNALTHPAGAAIATTMLIESQRQLTEQLQRVTETQAETNEAMAATIRQMNAHQRVRDTLTRAATSGNGTLGLARALNSLTRRPVLVQDSFGSERAYIAPSSSSPPPSVAMAEATAPSSSERFDGWRVSPVGRQIDQLGFLGVYDPDVNVNDDDVFAIDYASALLAVDLSNAKSTAEVELRLGRDLVGDLLSGQDPLGSATRAAALRYNLNVPQWVVLLRWETAPPSGSSFEIAVQRALSRLKLAALVSGWSDATVAIVSGAMDGKRLYTELVETTGGGHGAIGIGGPAGADRLPSSFAEARRALQVRARLHEPHGVTTHQELGLDRILDSSDGGVEINRFIRQWLGPLLDHDRDRRSDLVMTLAAYLDAGGKYDAAATALVIHRSTLRYRLARIRELVARDFSDPEVRLNLHVAVRAWSVMEGLPVWKGRH